ncbi:hypothetical protein V8E51_012838 [Hyaloscypha variabilis]
MSTHSQFNLFTASDWSIPDEPGRQRKTHRKSRAGCNNCKSRKVKCDESFPQCRACLKRGAQCLYGRSLEAQDRGKNNALSQKVFRSHNALLPIGNRSSVQHSGISSLMMDNSLLIDDILSSDETLRCLHALDIESINLPEMNLIRHFNAITSRALPYGQMFWKKVLATVALENSYVMHAVLTVAASHCRFLYPSTHSTRYCELECLHRIYALSSLRDALDAPLNQENFDPVFTCSVLLLIHSWSLVDTMKAGEIDFGADDVLLITRGTRDIVFEARKQGMHSIFGGVLNPSFEISAQQFPFPELQSLSHSLNPERTDNTYSGAATSMISILGAIKSKAPCNTRKYLLSWPARCSKDYITAIQGNDEQALAILAHFYAAASTISEPCGWLFTTRSSLMCRAIVNRLGSRWANYLTVPKTMCRFEGVDGRNSDDSLDIM